jgi:hypothetical protein
MTAPETPQSLDDLVDRWHEGDGEGVELHEYLGMSWDEYCKWVGSAHG